MEVLLSGFLGALLVFLLGALREWWRNERERRGLLRLLLAEIEHNGEVVRTVWESGKPSLVGSPNIRLMTARTWRETQARGAQLLPNELFGELDVYYSLLERLLTLLNFRDMGREHQHQFLRSLFAKKLGEEFPRSADPWIWYRDQTLEAQDLAKRRIEEYLARPWWGLLFLRADQWTRRRGGRKPL